MQNIKILIDKASKVCGNQTALSVRLGIHKSQLSEMKSGKQPMPPALAILIADIAHENVADAAIAAIIQNEEGTERGEKIKAVLGKLLLAGVLGLSLNTHSQAETNVYFVVKKVQELVNKIYIVEYVTGILRLLARSNLAKLIHSFGSTYFITRPTLHIDRL